MGRLPDDQIRRLTADVEILQAQVTGMMETVVAFGTSLEALTNLTATLASHTNRLAARLAEERNT